MVLATIVDRVGERSREGESVLIEVVNRVVTMVGIVDANSNGGVSNRV